MEPINTLYKRNPAPPETLPPALAAAYGGGLIIPQGTAQRPYMLANFVGSLDGVTTYGTPGNAGGGAISGNSESDHIIMGLLRAASDAVIFGAGSLRKDKGAIRTPQFIYPPHAADYAALRAQLGKTERQPLCVVVSASGAIDLTDAVLRQPDQHTIIATTPTGAAELAAQALPSNIEIRTIETTADGGVSPTALLALLGHDYGVRVALHEGGPRLLSVFLAAGALDELFLTLAPQLVGRNASPERLALLEGLAFTPETAPWSTLLSVKRAANHLFLRYAIQR